MIFLENKYQRWYLEICSRAVGRSRAPGMERHHILPKSLGGTNAAENMVFLPYREHFIAHWLLTKFTHGAALRKMNHALGCMRRNADMRELTAWQYERAKTAHWHARIGVPRSPETIERMRAGRKEFSPEALARIAAASSSRRPSEETKRKIIAALTGRPVSAETRAKIGAANRSPSKQKLAKMRAIRPSAETRTKLSAAARNRSAEHRAKLSAVNLGKVLSAETRAKIGAANRVRQVSPETRAKMRATHKAIWAARKVVKDSHA